MTGIDTMILNWKFINGFGSLLERGMRRSATLGALQVKRELRLADEVPGVIPGNALNYFRINSFQVAHVENQALLDSVKEKLADSLRGGGTLRDFKRDLPGMFDNYGVTPLHDFHARTVFDTNMHRAYMGGRIMAMNESSPDLFPYYQYHTAGDEKVRYRGKQLNNKIFRRDDPNLAYVWEILNEYNCRCNLTPISIYEAQAEGLEPTAPDELKLPERLENSYEPDSSMLFNQHDWWVKKMGADWAATPATYGLGEIAPAAGGIEAAAIINTPSEVWSTPGPGIDMRYLKRSGSDVYFAEVNDAGEQPVRRMTPNEAEQYRRGVLVFLK